LVEGGGNQRSEKKGKKESGEEGLKLSHESGNEDDNCVWW